MKKMKAFENALAALLVAGALTACSSEELQVPAGKARLSVKLDTSTAFNAGTRSLNEDNWKNTDNYTVELLDEEGNVTNTYAQGEIPASVELESGTYTFRAYCGEEQIASRSTFLTEGSATVTLNVGDEKSVTINCAPTCGKVQTKFGAEMGTYYSDYYVTYTTPKMEEGTSATWAKDDAEPWYLAVGEQGDVVTATIHLTPNAEYRTDEEMVEGTIVRTYTLLRDKAWTLNIAPQYDSSKGTLGVTIEIDDSTNDHTVDVVIPAEWIN